jgi:hypothetical protein
MPRTPAKVTCKPGHWWPYTSHCDCERGEGGLQCWLQFVAGQCDSTKYAHQV